MSQRQFLRKKKKKKNKPQGEIYDCRNAKYTVKPQTILKHLLGHCVLSKKISSVNNSSYNPIIDINEVLPSLILTIQQY